MALEVKECEMAAMEHDTALRQYAHVFHLEDTICVAPEFFQLPINYQTGILAHEIGHILSSANHSEGDANRTALLTLGIPIEYRDSPYGQALEYVPDHALHTSVDTVNNYLDGKRNPRGRRNPAGKPLQFPKGAKSGAQYRFLQAARSGASYAGSIPTRIASELIHRTPGRKRSEYMKQANPETPEELFESFHGRPAEEDIDIIETQHYQPTQPVAGLLEELVIIDDSSFKLEYGCCIGFKHHDHRSAFAKGGSSDETVYLTMPNRHQLDFIGGDQKLPYDGNKSLENVGPVWSITYWTDKHHLAGETGFGSYHHYFGEESVPFNSEKASPAKVLERLPFLPTLTYDTVNQKLSLVGGVYTITPEGIKD